MPNVSISGFHGLGSDKRVRRERVRQVLREPKEVNRVFREYFQIGWCYTVYFRLSGGPAWPPGRSIMNVTFWKPYLDFDAHRIFIRSDMHDSTYVNHASWAGMRPPAWRMLSWSKKMPILGHTPTHRADRLSFVFRQRSDIDRWEARQNIQATERAIDPFWPADDELEEYSTTRLGAMGWLCLFPDPDECPYIVYGGDLQNFIPALPPTGRLLLTAVRCTCVDAKNDRVYHSSRRWTAISELVKQFGCFAG